MDRRDSYLFKAAELSELARNEHYAVLKAEFENLARAYLRLADQAERNRHPDIVYGTPLINDGAAPADNSAESEEAAKR